MFLNSLKGVALTYIEAWPLREIQTWSFDHMVEVPGARFELTIKQAATGKHARILAAFQSVGDS